MGSGVRQVVSSQSRFARLGGEIAWVLVGQGVATVGALVGVRILTGLMSPARYGELALGITLGTLGQLVAWSPISGAVLRYFAPAQQSRQLSAYLLAVRRLLVVATAAMMGLSCIVTVALVGLGAVRWIGLSLAALLFTLLSGYEAALDNMQLAGRQRRIVAWHQGASMWFRLLMAALLVTVFGPSSAIAMIGYAIGVMLVLASQLFFFRQRVLAQRDHHQPALTHDVELIARQMSRYAWPIAAWGVFGWIPAVADRWVLQGFTTTSTVGVYMVVNQLGFYPMTLLSAVSLQFISPVLFERAGDGSNRGRVDDAWRMVVILVSGTLALTAVATVGAFVLHEPIFRLFAGARYRQVSRLLPWMVCAGGLFATGQAASQAVLVAGKTRRLIVPRGVLAVVTLGLFTLGAHLWGLAGIVYANVAFGVLYVGWMLFLATDCRVNVVRAHCAASPDGSVT